MPDDQSSLLNPDAVAGHNAPPEPTPYELHKLRVDEMVRAANAWLTQVAEIKDDEQAGRASDFINQLRGLGGDKGVLETQRLNEGRRLREEIAAIDTRYKALRSVIGMCFDKVNVLLDAHLKKKEARLQEEARKAQEEADRLKREAEEKARVAREAEEAAARAAQAKRDAEEAERRAEEEKLRLEAEAEQRRLEVEEAERQAEEDRKRAEAEAAQRKRDAEEAQRRAAEEKNAADRKRLEAEAEQRKRDAEAAERNAEAEKKRLAAEAEQRKRDDEAARIKAAEDKKRADEEAARAKANAATLQTVARNTDVIGAALEAQAATETAAAATKVATTAAVAKPQAKGEFSDRAVGLRTTWFATVTDIDKAFGYYKNDPKILELLESLGSADARSGRRIIPGFKVDSRRSV